MPMVLGIEANLLRFGGDIWGGGCGGRVHGGLDWLPLVQMLPDLRELRRTRTT